MKIAITATQGSLEAQVDPRFGRCACFLIVETDDLSYEIVENPNGPLGGGAGIQSAQLMTQRGLRYVFTGNCGPNAHKTLTAAGIGVVAGCSGVIRDVVARFSAGQCFPVADPTVSDHYGMKDRSPDVAAGAVIPTAFEMGRGGGRGMGGGGGMGGRRGRGLTFGMGPGKGGGRGMGRGGTGTGANSGMFSAFPPASMSQQTEGRLQPLQERINRVNQRTRPVARIDPNLCEGCGACADICPHEAIRVIQGVAQVNEELCSGCGACAGECSTGAIQIA